MKTEEELREWAFNPDSFKTKEAIIQFFAECTDEERHKLAVLHDQSDILNYCIQALLRKHEAKL